jgi:hypothetical protein
MAAAVKVIKTFPLGNTSALVLGTVALDSSYPTGGEAITIPDAEYVLDLDFSATAANDFIWDGSGSAPKIIANVSATGVEVANTTDLSALTAIRFRAIVGG